MLLHVRTNGTIIDEGASRDRTAIDGNNRVDEIPVIIFVTDAKFGDLAGAAADWILMALRAGRGVEHRTQAEIGILSFLKDLLITGERIPGWFGQTVAEALGARVLGLERWRIKARRGFGRGLLGKQTDGYQAAACH